MNKFKIDVQKVYRFIGNRQIKDVAKSAGVTAGSLYMQLWKVRSNGELHIGGATRLALALGVELKDILKDGE